MLKLHDTLESLVASEGVSGIIDALVEICDPKDLSSEEMKRSPSLGHNWMVLKAAKLALSDYRYMVKVEVKMG